jgi:hypothetical protein
MEGLNLEIIDSIDKELLLLNNQISFLEFQETTEATDHSEKIQSLEYEIYRMLHSNIVRDLLSRFSLIDPVQQHKMNILQGLVRFSVIEYHPDILSIRKRVKKTLSELHYFDHINTLMNEVNQDKRKQAHLEISEFCSHNDDLFKEFIHTHNRIAHQNGYANYAEAKLDSEGLTEKEFTDFFLTIHQNGRSIVQEWVYDNQGKIESFDVYHSFKDLKPSLDWKTNNSENLLTHLLTDFQISLSELPISISWQKMDFAGACFRIKPGKDVRLVINQDLEGLSVLHYALHELGHVIYYCFCPIDSELLLDNHLSREIMADIWTNCLEDPYFLKKAFQADEMDIQRYLIKKMKYDQLNLQIQSRDAVFIYEAFKNPDVSLSKIWTQITEYWLEIDDTYGGYDVFDFFAPLDQKSYAFSYVLARQLFLDVTQQRKNPFASSENLKYMREKLFSPGSLIDWKKKFHFGKLS